MLKLGEAKVYEYMEITRYANVNVQLQCWEYSQGQEACLVCVEFQALTHIMA